MGKGDKKTRRGKIVKGSYGVLRKRKKSPGASSPGPTGSRKEKDVSKPQKPAAESKPAKGEEKVNEVKKPAAKKVSKTDKPKKTTTTRKEKPSEKSE